MTIIETHYVDQSETFIQLYNEGKSRKEILDTLQIGKGAYSTYLRDNRHKIKTLTTTCPICGKTFHKKNNGHKYCSLRCKATAKNERDRKKRQIYPKHRTCIICGQPFTTNYPNHKYCTPECSKIAQREHQRQNYHKHRDEILARRKELYHKQKEEKGW